MQFCDTRVRCVTVELGSQVKLGSFGVVELLDRAITVKFQD